MGLKDLKTDLKSLKYGGDRLGNGNSNQPYIQTDINTGKLSVSNSRGIALLQPIETAITGVANTVNRIGGVIGNVDDGFIRGGVIGAAQASTTDLLRIGKFFTDVPKGPLFIARQIGLQLSNPRLEVKKGTRGILNSISNLDLQSAAASLTGGTFQPTRIYNLGINTLAQVPATAFGIHFNRHGLLPFQDDESKYLKVAQLNNEGKDAPNNRLVGLKNQLKIGDQKLNNPPSLLRKIANLPFKIIGSVLKGKPLDIFKGEDTLDYYIGGPKSVYGIGTTTIRRYDYTENKTRINDALSQSNDKARLAKVDWDLALGGNYPISGRDNASPTKVAKSLDNKTEIFNPNVENQNVIKGLNTISPAAKNYKKLKEALDELSKKEEIVKSTVPSTDFSTSILPLHAPETTYIDKSAPDFRYYGTPKINSDFSQAEYTNTNQFSRLDADILTIAFRIIDPFTLNGDRILLSAYMNGFKDSFGATWNETNYVGRAESFYTYNKFKRSVSFNLQIPCFNREELFEKHRGLGQLAAVTAGSYNNNFLGGVLIKLNVGNYIIGEYGILNSLDYSIPPDATWDILPDGRLSMYIDASFNCTMVHKDLPQYQQGQGFFKYLNNPKTSFLPSITNPDTFVIDDYGKNQNPTGREIINIRANSVGVTQNSPLNTNALSGPLAPPPRITDTRTTQAGQFGTRINFPTTQSRNPFGR